MYYYREIGARIKEFKVVYNKRPRIAMIRLILCNLFFIFRKSDNDYFKKCQKEKILKENKEEKEKLLLLMMDNISYLNNEFLSIQKELYRQEIIIKKQTAKKGEAIHIVFITDNKYAYPTSIAISSIEYNCKPENNYQIHVIGVDLNKEMKNLLIESGRNVECVDVSEKYLDIEFEHEHVSKAALFKFNIAEIFSDFDKILYLDSDVLVLDDLSELYKTDIDKKYGAVVKDYHILLRGYKGLDEIQTKDYFNSGVLLMNLEEMRNNHLADILTSTKRKISNNSAFSFMDQDVFNIIYKNKVIFLSVKYNFLNCYYEEIEKFEMQNLTKLCCDEIWSVYSCPTILHIGGNNKPWKSVMGEKRLLYEKYMMINELYKENLKE